MMTPIQHHDWLALIEISGPFLAVPVLKETFPQGLEELDSLKRKRLRQAYEEWREALETDDPQFAELHAAWIDEVLSRGLELDEDGKGDVLKRTDWCAANLTVNLPEHGLTLSPDLAVIDEQRANRSLMLIHTYGQDVDLNATLKLDGWAATPADRMVQLCRATGCRLGLVTNGERWMLVDAPVGAVTTFASWYARIWSQEPITLQAFVHLLGIRRFFVDEAEQLPALFDRSMKYQDEVTDALGEQVRRAVEVLIQALDKADQDRDRELLRDVKEPELYEAALTVMMRLVFLLSAEERGLLLLGDERYEANYALSTLRMQLRKESEEILERRWDAWSRLLAIFRAVFGGIEHENLRLPALGGSLFDPDRFPFFEGRAKGSDWRTDTAKPLPIDNRTVLLLLEAIQQFQGRTLSYRALDVEQIGYVYEGLLERTVKRTAEVTLELDGTKNAKAPWVKLAELESARLDGAERLAELLQERSGSSASRVRNDLARPVDDALADRLLAACHGDTALRDRIKPFAHLVRTDPWGYPLVYPAGAFIVTTGSDRRETGTHYTPKSLTEAIVTETLTPIAYGGPAEGTPREQWVLKSAAELLDLKICDPAMGSGAFLVQACRWLADRLVEAWSQAEATGRTVSVNGEVSDTVNAKEPLPRDTEARTVIARRLIAERCLYGVDLNPLAVELAKLSIWLVTLAKGRPFGFLDHNLRCGDSLLGIHRLDQLIELSMAPTGKGQQRLFGQNIERAVHEAIELRQRLRELPIRDIHDVEAMASLYTEARRWLKVPEIIADALISEAFVTAGNASALERGLTSLAVPAGDAVDGNQEAVAALTKRVMSNLSVDQPVGKSSRHPFHWPIEFPEVFESRGGFDAIVGNPPFLGGRQLTDVLGAQHQKFLQVAYGAKNNTVDLVCFFFRMVDRILHRNGYFGFLSTNSIADTENRNFALDSLLDQGHKIIFALSPVKWPGSASVDICFLLIGKAKWEGDVSINHISVKSISSRISSSFDASVVSKLTPPIKYSEGTKLYGKAFVRTKAEFNQLEEENPGLIQYLRRYINGDVLNGKPASPENELYVVDFGGLELNEISGCDGFIQLLCEQVTEERKNQTRQIHETRPWLHWDKRTSFYELAREKERIIATVIVSTHLIFQFVDPRDCFSHGLKLFLDDRLSMLGILQSSIHYWWASSVSSSFRTYIRYSTSTSFDTFPFLERSLASEAVETAAKHLIACRFEIAQTEKTGLTEVYNWVNNPEITDVRIEALRTFHGALDQAIADSYEWNDLTLSHCFCVTEQGLRFTLSEASRLEVLRRLTLLNIQRHKEELALSPHGGISTIRTSRIKHSLAEAIKQQSMDFSDETSVPHAATDEMASIAILDQLHSQSGWLAKRDILIAVGISDSQWNVAIADLINRGQVERQGDRRGARYRAFTDRREE